MLVCLIKDEILNLSSIRSCWVSSRSFKKPLNMHPIIWSLVLGLKRTASTFFMMDEEETTTGDIVSQMKVEISADDSAAINVQ